MIPTLRLLLATGIALAGVAAYASPREQAADAVTWNGSVQAVWQERCAQCHGADSPSATAFEADEEAWIARGKGPRMASHAEIVQFVVWPDTGALMRRLDDGRNTEDGQPGSMYLYLGEDEDERQRNLALFRAWVGEDGWTLKRWDAVSKQDLDRIRAYE